MTFNESSLPKVVFKPSFSLSIEENFKPFQVRQWMEQYWWISIPLAGLYVILVLLGRKWMEKRERFDLRSALAVWSGLLAVYSILTVVRTLPEFAFILKTEGLEGSVCNPTVYYGNTGLWLFLFIWSKAPELGDTAFIVLRKSPLIFLHVWHHALTLIYCWYLIGDFNTIGRWGVNLNAFVHSLMYTYYTLKALRIYVPRFMAMILTTAQILQFVAGMYAVFIAYRVKNRGDYCQNTYTYIYFSAFVYSSYLILFVNFFYQTYLSSSKSKGRRGDGQSAKKLN